MAKSTIQLQEEENYYFHLNYTYMWKKLNTAPYYVSGTGEMPQWIHDPWLLPSYVNLSRCMNPEYVPSLNLVNKIIQFYNANIEPAVDSYQFLHEKLAETNELRSTVHRSDTQAYCGMYRGYYYAGTRSQKTVYGAVLRISKVRDETIVQMISGLTDQAAMNDPALLKLFDKPSISLEEYRQYYDHLELSRKRTSLFRGEVTLTPGVLNLEMQSMDHDGTLVFFRSSARTGADQTFLGSLGLMSMISNQQITILKMGIVRSDIKGLKPMSPDDPQVGPLLDVNKLPNEHICLSMQEGADWNDLIMNSQEG